jgi:methionine-rich copper-binding protein CopC
MRISCAPFCLVLLVLGVLAAQAHASLDRANPSVGSTVRADPHEVMLTFTDQLEPAFSTVIVTEASGVEVSQGKAQISGRTMRVGLKALGSGTYKVIWRAVSIDSHRTEGSFTFRVDMQ